MWCTCTSKDVNTCVEVLPPFGHVVHFFSQLQDFLVSLLLLYALLIHVLRGITLAAFHLYSTKRQNMNNKKKESYGNETIKRNLKRTSLLQYHQLLLVPSYHHHHYSSTAYYEYYRRTDDPTNTTTQLPTTYY